MIKSGGEWISSLQLEDMLRECAGVSAAAVIPIPDERWGERAFAVIVPKASHVGRLTEQEVVSHIQRYVDDGVIWRWAVPVGVRFVDALDKTGVGKFDKKLLRQEYHTIVAQPLVG